jgi:hypothetical protein
VHVRQRLVRAVGEECTLQAPLAIRYNDKSVLESMHSAELFTIMQDADCNVLATLPDDQQRLVRAKAPPNAGCRTWRCVCAPPPASTAQARWNGEGARQLAQIISMILGTDMAFHFKHLADFKAKTPELKTVRLALVPPAVPGRSRCCAFV